MARPESSARDKARRVPSASTKAETVEEVASSSSSAPPADEEEDLEGEEAGSLAPLEEELAATFEEWDRRYRDDPDGFEDLFAGTPATYGEAAARWFVGLFDEVNVDVEVTVEVSAELEVG
jgi:hypothetical protein